MKYLLLFVVAAVMAAISLSITIYGIGRRKKVVALIALGCFVMLLLLTVYAGHTYVSLVKYTRGHFSRDTTSADATKNFNGMLNIAIFPEFNKRFNGTLCLPQLHGHQADGVDVNVSIE